MSSANPFKDLEDECNRVLERTLSEDYPEITFLKTDLNYLLSQMSTATKLIESEFNCCLCC